MADPVPLKFPPEQKGNPPAPARPKLAAEPRRRLMAGLRRYRRLLLLGVLPLVATVQMEVSYPVRLSSTITRVNATRRPSGESCGSVIHVNRKRSFSLMGRLAAEPGADADDGLGALV